jgi:hypothetical protein
MPRAQDMVQMRNISLYTDIQLAKITLVFGLHPKLLGELLVLDLRLLNRVINLDSVFVREVLDEH